MTKALLITVLGAGICLRAFTQDSVRVVNDASDTVLVKSYANRYNPTKALLFAAVLPGLGQVYNKKYWKLPLVYGGFFGVGFVLKIYQDGYIKYRAELFDLLETDPKGVSASNLNVTQLRTVVDRYRRERDYWVILSFGMYALQIIDAHVDAHLKEFDLNPDLSVRLKPYAADDLFAGRNVGITLSIKF